MFTDGASYGVGALRKLVGPWWRLTPRTACQRRREGGGGLPLFTPTVGSGSRTTQRACPHSEQDFGLPLGHQAVNVHLGRATDRERNLVVRHATCGAHAHLTPLRFAHAVAGVKSPLRSNVGGRGAHDSAAQELE